MAATVLVGVSLGFLLIRVTNGLVDANTSRSIAEANVGLAAAQQVVLQASEGGPPPPSEGLADSIMNSLVTSDDRGAAYEVLLLEGSSAADTQLSGGARTWWRYPASRWTYEPRCASRAARCGRTRRSSTSTNPPNPGLWSARC